MDKKCGVLGKMEVAQKALRIQDLNDKVGIAIKQFESAQKRFESGQDSYKEWQNIIKLLNMEIRDIQHFQAVAHHNLGIIHAGRREFKKAEELFLKAIELDPDYAIAYYNLALVYKNLNDMDRARQYLARSRELGYCP